MMPSLMYVYTLYLQCVSRIIVQVFAKKKFKFEISILQLVSDKKVPVLNQRGTTDFPD